MSAFGVNRPRGAATPTSAGRFQAPTAPGSRSRRAATPNSASRNKQALSTAPPKPKLTNAQQLEILQRLETGNYKRGVGISQFYEEFTSTSNNESAKFPCKQNLFASFASLDPIASSTTIGSNGSNKVSGSMESLLSISSSVVSSVPSSHSQGTGGNTSGSSEVTVIEAHAGSNGDYQPYRISVNAENLAPHLKVMENLIETFTNYQKAMERLVDLQCKAKFAQLLPQEKMINFFKSLQRVQKIIEKFLQGNASENMDIFMPARQNKGISEPSVLHCNVERHTEVVGAIYELSKIIDRIDVLAQDDFLDINLEAKLECLTETTNKLEDLLKIQEKHSSRVNDLIRKTVVLEMKDDKNTNKVFSRES